MEVGTWNGNHARQMIKSALKFHNEVKYIGFDLFENITDEEIQLEASKSIKANYESVRQLLEKIPGANVELYVGYTRDTIPVVPTEPIDFIFLDGGHSPKTIKLDWSNIQRFVYRDTYIIFDDYWENRIDFGCKLLVDDLYTRQANWQIDFLNPVDVFPDKRIRMVRAKRRF